ncbi:translation initiation factor IF-2-like [Nycticebus coucang]|uniref:translation initiation factor IF-2-like n=1 Tax=Nycticebus coucang TaxID=9470 RepID=UPI00234D5D7B|nr:translation initiation factor IF-2-like [Nycticebus coucang]
MAAPGRGAGSGGCAGLLGRRGPRIRRPAPPHPPGRWGGVGLGAPAGEGALPGGRRVRRGGRPGRFLRGCRLPPSSWGAYSPRRDRAGGGGRGAGRGRRRRARRVSGAPRRPPRVWTVRVAARRPGECAAGGGRGGRLGRATAGGAGRPRDWSPRGHVPAPLTSMAATAAATAVSASRGRSPRAGRGRGKARPDGRGGPGRGLGGRAPTGPGPPRPGGGGARDVTPAAPPPVPGRVLSRAGLRDHRPRCLPPDPEGRRRDTTAEAGNQPRRESSRKGLCGRNHSVADSSLEAKNSLFAITGSFSGHLEKAQLLGQAFLPPFHPAANDVKTKKPIPGSPQPLWKTPAHWVSVAE